MALTVEDGGAKPDGESYSGVDDADTFVDNWHGDQAWTDASTTAKERALRKGTRFVDMHRFRGHRLTDAQALDWPRDDVGIVDGQYIHPGTIPEPVKEAAIEAALRDVRGEDLFPDHDGGKIESESSQVGELSTSTTYATPRDQVRTFEAVRQLLRPYLASTGQRRVLRGAG